jgi:hypothetical protein
VAQLGDVVAPELEAHRLRHAEAVDVEDPAAHAELRDVLHHGNPLKANGFEMRGQLLGPSSVSLSQLESRGSQRARKLGALQQRSTGGDDDSKVAAADSLERLDPFAGYLRVGLRFPEALARRVEGDALRLHERHQVGEPALGAGDVVVQHHEEAARKILRERSEHHGVARSVKAAQRAAPGGPGQIAQQLPEFTQRLEDREQLWERHGAK